MSQVERLRLHFPAMDEKEVKSIKGGYIGFWIGFQGVLDNPIDLPPVDIAGQRTGDWWNYGGTIGTSGSMNLPAGEATAPRINNNPGGLVFNMGYTGDGGGGGGSNGGNVGGGGYVRPDRNPGTVAPGASTNRVQPPGGYVRPTRVIDPPPNVTPAQSYYKEHFPDFKLGKFSLMVLQGSTPPPGMKTNSDGRYVTDKTKDFVDGVTNKEGALEIITVTLDPYFTKMTPLERQEIMGYELVHAKNIDEHYDLFKSDPEQFRKNSEYAAWTYEYNVAKTAGDQNAMNVCTQMQQKFKDGKAANWQWKYDDIPLQP